MSSRTFHQVIANSLLDRKCFSKTQLWFPTTHNSTPLFSNCTQSISVLVFADLFSAMANAMESIRELSKLKERLQSAEEILRQIKAEEEKFQKRNQEAQRKFEVMSNMLPFLTLLTHCLVPSGQLSSKNWSI